MAKKRAKGRPKKPGNWKKVLVTLESSLVDWVEDRSTKAGCTRSEFVTLLISSMQLLYCQGYVRFGPGAAFWFREIPDAERFRKMVESGEVLKMLDTLGDRFTTGLFLSRAGSLEEFPSQPPPDDSPTREDGIEKGEQV